MRYNNVNNWVRNHTFRTVLEVDPESGEPIKWSDPVLYVPGEINEGGSDTIPGQGITPREIIARYVSRKALPSMNGVFTDNQVLPANFERMNKVEKLELAHKMLGIMADRFQKNRERRSRVSRELREARKGASAPDPSPTLPEPAGQV